MATTGAASRIATAKLRSDNPLINPPESRFTYSYPFAGPGEQEAFYQRGGHYQVICEGASAHRSVLIFHVVWDMRGLDGVKQRAVFYLRFNTSSSECATAEPGRISLPSLVCPLTSNCRSSDHFHCS